MQVPIQARVRVWWRYEAPASTSATLVDCNGQCRGETVLPLHSKPGSNGEALHSESNREEGMQRKQERQPPPSMLIYDGMKLLFSSRLCADVSQYMTSQLKMLQPNFDVAQIEDDQLYDAVMAKKESEWAYV